MGKYDYIDTLKNLVIDLQKNLTKIKAINPENGGDGEYNKFLFLKNYLSNWGFDNMEEIFVPDERVSSKVRPTLIVTLNGKEKDRRLWIITHTDVVPEGEIKLWDTDPFEAVVKDDKIYGRGTEDNQQSLVSSLVAVKFLLDNKIIPQFSLKLMFVADEEVGSGYGIDWILKNKNIFNKNDLILTPDVGDPEGNSIEIAEKSILWVTFKINGKQSHGSRPDKGINAARASSYLCVRLDELYKIYDEKNTLFDIPYSTFEPTKRIGTVTNMNTIPGEETLGLDCRILPCYKIEEVLTKIQSIAASVEKDFGVKIEISIQQRLQAAPPTDKDAPVVKLLQKAIKNIHNKEAKLIGIGGGTVAAYFRMEGIQAALWSTVDNTMHSPNEYSSIKSTLSDAKVFADIMLGAD
ncbi:MAG: diaminopimelate aminotransferase [Spirochaetes bacterium GWD1_27_9]|nr:MAG: diaminopimelate aminotransferase [Spirochaetes bacterium GWB1_27_13]OHD27881.1 MAG: diaminopimelate aminotransferase [Spirochaetes bacterium GWC1_27_15]OHD43407.1 MAG: diaminopimelate aminotransferase [Spirochaetes bacterium GWD1_27_9]